MDRDFNKIREWLLPKLDAAGLSVEAFARMTDLTRSAVYYYLSDKSRPTEDSMVRMCHVLGVPLEEGLRQYTPKKVGRPRTRPVKVVAGAL